MPLVRVENLEKSFKDLRVIKGLNFELENGKCVALIGANGAGKTTTLKMLSEFAGTKQRYDFFCG